MIMKTVYAHSITLYFLLTFMYIISKFLKLIEFKFSW